jgi:TPR repeat protein
MPCELPAIAPSRTGDGVPQDKAQAAQLFRRAADQGLADAQYSLGGCYAEGEGVPQDKAQAARLYQQAADKGLIDAQYSLCVCYSTLRIAP